MKAIAFSTMVDIAEREFNILIRKKLNTKPPYGWHCPVCLLVMPGT
jgi:hypothetical protein